MRREEKREEGERKGKECLRTARESPTLATKRYRFVTSFSK
jgi:hypothetical protein